ncbi:MAG: hypothetical protein GY754_29170 [bacterium]|nr:hypothetical protein [bacterium]
MDTKTEMINQLKTLADQWYQNAGEGKDNTKTVKNYCQKLSKLYETGWNYSLYLVNEIPQEYLPEFYLERTKEIVAGCFDKLGYLLDQYLDNKDTPAKRDPIIEEYHKILEEMFKIGHDEDDLFIDMDTCLKDEYMPDFYTEEFILNDGINMFDREHKVNDPENRKVRTIGLSQLFGEEPEEWF